MATKRSDYASVTDREIIDFLVDGKHFLCGDFSLDRERELAREFIAGDDDRCFDYCCSRCGRYPDCGGAHGGCIQSTH